MPKVFAPMGAHKDSAPTDYHSIKSESFHGKALNFAIRSRCYPLATRAPLKAISFAPVGGAEIGKLREGTRHSKAKRVTYGGPSGRRVSGLEPKGIRAHGLAERVEAN